MNAPTAFHFGNGTDLGLVRAVLTAIGTEQSLLLTFYRLDRGAYLQHRVRVRFSDIDELHRDGRVAWFAIDDGNPDPEYVDVDLADIETITYMPSDE